MQLFNKQHRTICAMLFVIKSRLRSAFFVMVYYPWEGMQFMEKKYINVIKRLAVYCIGLFIMALGVSVSKTSDLGVSPVNSIPCVLSVITNIDMGICTTVVFVSFILIQILIMNKEFKWFNLLQIFCSSLFGLFVSLSNFLCNNFLPPCTNYGMRLVYVCISMALVALGILFYISANILSLPGEGVMQAVAYKTKIQLSTAKMIFDWSVVVIAAILSVIALHELNGVREGTIIAAFGVGILLKLFTKCFDKPLTAFLTA